MSDRSGKRLVEYVTIRCSHVGCDKTQRLRRSRLITCDGYACNWEHGPRKRQAPGLMREMVMNAAGGFIGWRDVAPDHEQSSAFDRAQCLKSFATATVVPLESTKRLLGALVEPAGPAGTRNIITIGEMSTGVQRTSSGIEIELPHVAAAFCMSLSRGDVGGVILRTFTNETAFTTAKGCPIPVKEVRGWLMAERQLHPLSEAEMFAAHCEDATTGELLAPEQGVAFRDTGVVELPG